jgi:pimeloyl-ACP methyl ester carboxylesterase
MKREARPESSNQTNSSKGMPAPTTNPITNNGPAASMDTDDATRSANLGLLLLHALPLDGSMWAHQMELFPGPTYAPTLYGLGNTVEAWASEALRIATTDRLVVVGCSVGGSCALEVAALAPQRVAALVLIGTKAKHYPEPGLHASALDIIERKGIDQAWRRFWAPLFSRFTDKRVIEAARNTARRQRPGDISCGVTAFHTRQSRQHLVAECKRPIVVVTGEDDIAPGVKASAELAAASRQGSFHVVPSCGHYVPLERPDVLGSILKKVISAQEMSAEPDSA